MKNNIISGIIGAAIIILMIVIVYYFIGPINYAPVYMLNPEKALSYTDTACIDSVKCLHIEVLKDLESKGVLLNPSEYISHVADYYNTLIAFLLGLFVIFTLGTIYSIKLASKKEIEDIKTDIKNYKTKTDETVKRKIIESLNELMRDSISFKESCVNALYGRMEDEILKQEDKNAIDERITKMEEKIEKLNKLCESFEETESSNQEIE